MDMIFNISDLNRSKNFSITCDTRMISGLQIGLSRIKSDQLGLIRVESGLVKSDTVDNNLVRIPKGNEL